MKNHIKNYIKIMGLAAVPFGTAQVHGEGYRTEIKVKRIKEEGSWRVDIEVKNFCSTELLRERSVSCSWDRNLLFSAMREGASTCRFPVVRVTLMGEWDVYRKNRHLDGNVEVKKGGMHVASFVLRSDLYCYLYFLPEGVDNEKFYEVAFLVDGDVKAEDILIVSSEEVLVFDFCRYFLAPGGKKMSSYNGSFQYEKIPDSLERHLRQWYFKPKKPKKAEAPKKELKIETLEVKNLKGKNHKKGKKYLRSNPDPEKPKEEIKEKPQDKPRELEVLEPKPEESTPTQARIKALFEADRARREKDPELEKERMRREKATINARNRIRELIRIDLESRETKEDKKIEKNEIILEEQKCILGEPKFEDKKEEKLFEGFSKEDYFKGFDVFKENLSAELKKNLEKSKSGKNEIKIEGKKSKEPEIFKSEDCFEFPENRFEFSEVGNPNPIKIEDKKEEEDKKEDAKIDQSEIAFGNKSLAESIYNNKSSKKSGKSNKSDDEDSEKSDDRDSVSKLTLGSDFD